MRIRFLKRRALVYISTAAVVGVAAFAASARWQQYLANPAGKPPRDGFEALRSRAKYIGSAQCAVCHDDRAASWAKTFHRTMTQQASEQSVQAPFDRRVLNWMGVASIPDRIGSKYTIDTTDPVSGANKRFEISRTVGSRRMQQYVTRIEDRYVRLPIAYSMEEKRWFHLSEAFFHPDGTPFHATAALWDANCIFCHNVKANPGWSEKPVTNSIGGIPGTFHSEVAQLGIACEACHGPGGEHAALMKSPLRRYAFEKSGAADPTIVNPSRLDQARSVMVCAHCHGQRIPKHEADIREVMAHGDPFTPGEDLSRYFKPVTRDTRIGSTSFASRFWNDGSPRLTAYEYQGITTSACYLKGRMTCLSCHAMHEGDPHGQMKPDIPGNKMCTQCHTEFLGTNLTNHSHHRAEGPGSSCVACHMPPVVYGIMSWHPTHEIKSPDPAHSATFHKPDACTVCHTDKSLVWADNAVRWMWPHDGRTTAPDPARFGSPDMIRALFAEDAVYRALAADRLGNPSPKLEMAKWAAPFLAQALVDNYPNVRRTAHNSLQKLTGYTTIPMALDQESARAEVATLFSHLKLESTPPGDATWPVTESGDVDRAKLEAWKCTQAEQVVNVGE